MAHDLEKMKAEAAMLSAAGGATKALSDAGGVEGGGEGGAV